MKLCIGLISVLSLSVSMSFAQTKQTQPTLQHFPVDSLVGNWVSYSIEFEETVKASKRKTIEKLVKVRCNVCPEISFKPDSTITVKAEGSDSMPVKAYRWTAEGGKLVIRSLSEYSSKLMPLSVGKYNIDIRANGLFGIDREVVLTDKKGVRYILTKSE